MDSNSKHVSLDERTLFELVYINDTNVVTVFAKNDNKGISSIDLFMTN